jgi:hypothetical protein
MFQKASSVEECWMKSGKTSLSLTNAQGQAAVSETDHKTVILHAEKKKRGNWS